LGAPTKTVGSGRLCFAVIWANPVTTKGVTTDGEYLRYDGHHRVILFDGYTAERPVSEAF